jgi:hypothetical protein
MKTNWVFLKGILRQIYGPKKNDVGDFEVRTNEELRSLFGEANIIGIMKSYRLRWAGHVWRSEGILGNITRWRPSTKRPRQRWADRIKEDLRIMGIENEEEVSNNREKWRDVVDAAMDHNGL